MSREIPTVSVSNYASIFTKPIFKNQNGEWYRDVGYTDSCDLIRENFLGARKSFVAIGYYLKHIKEKRLYEEGGYKNIWECAEAEFGLSQPSATNYMKMNDSYSVNGDTPILDERYSGFNKSQLQEMLALPEEKREEIQPGQTVSEIRQIVREEKKRQGPSEKEIRQFYDRLVKDMDEPHSTLKERLRDKYRNGGGGDGSFDWTGSARGVRINKCEEITWAQLVKLIHLYIPKQVVPENRADENEYLEEPQLPGQMNFTDYPNVMPENKEKNETNAEDGNEVEIDEHIRQELQESEEVLEENTEPDVESCYSNSFVGITDIRLILEQEKRLLNDYLKVGGLPEKTVFRQKMIVGALVAMVCDLEEQGLSIKLPCKMGDTLYRIDIEENTKIEDFVIEHIVICDNGDILFHDASDDIICQLENIITYEPYLDCYRVFLTREEAEAALQNKAGR